MTSSSAAAAAREALSAAADPDKAPAMQAYMKTEMPFYGVQTPIRRGIARDLARRFPPADAPEYGALVLALWAGPSREEKYLALDLAQRFRTFIRPAQLGLYERLIREGAWWDLVDGVASRLVGGALAHEPEGVAPVLDRWIDDPNLWIRRAAIIAQLNRKGDTDAERLFRYCLARAHEAEFFIRKAIGWALRQYAKTDPDAVSHFLRAHREVLSNLSYREASKHLMLS